MKKIFVLILVLLSVAIFGLLIFFRLNKKEHDVVSISKIITPTAKIKKIDAEGVEENSEHRRQLRYRSKLGKLLSLIAIRI